MRHVELMKSSGATAPAARATIPPQFRLRAAAVAALRWLIRDSRVALVTTRDGEGALYTEPMETLERDFDGELWFAVSESASVVEHVAASPNIQVAYVDNNSNRCLVVDGIAHVCRDADPVHIPRLSPFGGKLGREPRRVGRTVLRVVVMSADIWE